MTEVVGGRVCTRRWNSGGGTCRSWQGGRWRRETEGRERWEARKDRLEGAKKGLIGFSFSEWGWVLFVVDSCGIYWNVLPLTQMRLGDWEIIVSFFIDFIGGDLLLLNLRFWVHSRAHPCKDAFSTHCVTFGFCMVGLIARAWGTRGTLAGSWNGGLKLIWYFVFHEESWVIVEVMKTSEKELEWDGGY